MSTTPTLPEVIEQAIESRLIDVHVSLPGRVVSWDADTQTGEIELMVTRLLEKADETLGQEPLPKLPNVPSGLPRTAGFYLSLPLAKGDTGLVVFSEASIDQWRARDECSSPGEARRHTLTGGVFYPGLFATARALADASGANMRLGEDGGVHLEFPPGAAAEIKTEGGTTDFVALQGLVEAELGKILAAISGAAIIPLDGGLAFKTAIVAALALFPSSVGATKLKAE